MGVVLRYRRGHRLDVPTPVDVTAVAETDGAQVVSLTLKVDDEHDFWEANPTCNPL
ncbi:MAG: hypothetical protein HKP61_10290 [Dactylosporangium sp.]|nr:hypothetical protein [Dactylosporangium sp.]NNJ61318.1 hypothetical protein [Dactylosporangium sp.]